MSHSDSALTELRGATRDIHHALERDLIIARPNAGREDYIAYLRALRGWIASFEHKLWESPWPEAIDAQARAQKLTWIDEDLRSVGHDAASLAALPLCPFHPPLHSMPERLGLAYVIEGAQLGGQVLFKRLEPVLMFWHPRWLRGYGADTAMRWKTFTASAERMLDTESDRKIAAAAARDAFKSLAEWCRLQQVA